MNTKLLKKTGALMCLFFLSAFAYAGEFYHTVQNGDTVYSISKRYGVSVDDVLFLNGVEDPRRIFSGQKLRIPSGSIKVPPVNDEMLKDEKGGEPDYTEYTAENGDTLYGIARKHGITYRELIAKNKFSAGYMLKTGDKIKIPGGKVPDAGLPPQAKAANPKESTKKESRPKDIKGAIYKNIKWPVSAKETVYMGGRLGGLLITGEKEEPVLSLTSGIVVAAGPYRGFGQVVIVKTGTNYKYIYGGCESLAVKTGDRVSPGTEVGKLGVDARSAKPQLTLIVYHDNKPVDPAKAPRA